MTTKRDDVTAACAAQGPFIAAEAAQGSADGAAPSSPYCSQKEMFVLRTEGIGVEIVYGLNKNTAVSSCYVRVNRVSVCLLT